MSYWTGCTDSIRRTSAAHDAGDVDLLVRECRFPAFLIRGKSDMVVY